MTMQLGKPVRRGIQDINGPLTAGFFVSEGGKVADIKRILSGVVVPGLELLPSRMDTPKARLMLLAIGLQESRFDHRRQIGGPARGLWQFERGGGVRGVLRHPSSKWIALDVCRARGVDPTESAVY